MARCIVGLVGHGGGGGMETLSKGTVWEVLIYIQRCGNFTVYWSLR